MSLQSIKNYGSSKLDGRLVNDEEYDLVLTSDRNDYDEEVIFSKNLIAEKDGNRLPINIDLNSVFTNLKKDLLWDTRINDNYLVSKNFYNPNNDDLSCFEEVTLCDVGLTSIDVGINDLMSGETMTFTMGYNYEKTFHPNFYDRRFKMHPVDTYADIPNIRFSGNPIVSYNIISKNDDKAGYYNELYGGFYQGFYKLHGYDYEVFPERVNKGWTSEMLLKPRQRTEPAFECITTINDVYPENEGFFFYFGARAENKFYHEASGEVRHPAVNRCDLCTFDFSLSSESGTTFNYDRYTKDLDCLKTCACYNTGVTTSDCISLYPKIKTEQQHNISSCNSYTEEVETPPVDPAMDVLSNAMGVRFAGDPKNPKLCVKYIKMTGDCITTVTCEKTGTEFCSGYTINEICSAKGIYDVCNYDSPICYTANTEERWVMISTVFERYETLEDCDLLNWGGLGDIRQYLYPSSINGASYNLIMPPHTNGEKVEKLESTIKINNKWFFNKDKRLGRLKLYVNGYLFMVIEDFEEIIPRELNTEKEKQIGVPFNISFGGGSIGLKESLIFKDCESPFGEYIQDPELMSQETLSGTTYSELRTNVLIEPNFAGSFMGGISQFRMYTEPLKSPQVQHNFRRLKDRFDLLNYWCPNCYSCLLDCYFNIELSEVLCDFDFAFCDVDCDFDVVLNDITCDFDLTITQVDIDIIDLNI